MRARDGLVLATVLALAALAPVRAADFDAASELLERGALTRARAAFTDLARAGDARAQDALAAMLLQGIGGPRDVQGAMGWYCLLAHQPAGGREVVHALWFLAEYFRTGGGLPGERWNDGAREREDPVRAYFWFSLMAAQAEFYEQVLDEGVTLGRAGRHSVGRELYEGEKQQVERRLQRWEPDRIPGSAGTCLELPRS
jgi:hypothetical protein